MIITEVKVSRKAARSHFQRRLVRERSKQFYSPLKHPPGLRAAIGLACVLRPLMAVFFGMISLSNVRRNSRELHTSPGVDSEQQSSDW